MAGRVAVIGGGPTGLMALKTFQEDGFDVTLFEGRSWVGGLWKYSTDAGLSAGENTVFNTSKYRAAISDFPMTGDMDDFPTAPQIFKYLNDYCDYFNLWPSIKLCSRVLTIKRQKSGWVVGVSPNEGKSYSEHFDKVAVATGTFTLPRTPTIPGNDLFAGVSLHAQNFHDPSRYKGKNILLVGFHATAQDVASALAGHASKVYLAHRSGLILMPRFDAQGSVYDRMPPLSFTILTLYLSYWMPSLFTWLMDNVLAIVSRRAYPRIPASWGLRPAPSSAVSTPLIASQIYPHLESGKCESVHAVQRITGSNSVELTSGRSISDIDAIIYCTGYDQSVNVNMVPEELNPYPERGQPPNLYRSMFPLHPDSSIRNSLAFLAQGAVSYAGFAQYEVQSMCVSQIWLENSKLPPLSEMLAWRRHFLAWRATTAKKYHAGDTFYAANLPMTDQILWMDETAGLGMRQRFGWIERWIMPEAWRFWWQESDMWALVLGGFASPAVVRLFETGKRKAWKGAKDQFKLDNERVRMGGDVKLQLEKT